jgi:pimeloyl-ACP methyl ester carboxylesterase
MPFLTIGATRLEYERIEPARPDVEAGIPLREGPGSAQPAARTIVLLHEGLGSVSMWRDFPRRLAQSTGASVVVYSREGYGKSSPLRAPREMRYMHDEALVVLPQLLDALEIENPVLFGHSDGASIALIYAGGSGRGVAGVIAAAPHLFVEDISVTSIAAAKVAFETTDLRERLGRYHDDVDGVFWAWNRIWLDPAFRAWNIEDHVARVRCPVLAMQGEQDEYGTMRQIDRIAELAPDVRLLKLPQCRHSPHRDQPEQVLTAVREWLSASLRP